MITAIVQARMGSTRLPGKVMREVAGRPLLDYMMERLRRSRRLEQVVVATSRLAADDPIARWCAGAGVKVYRGDEEDVLARYHEAAAAFGATVVVRLTSDCPLIDPGVVDRVVETFLRRRPEAAFVANTVPPPSRYPDGMDVEVFGRDLLERSHREARLPSEREHVTFHMWRTGLFPLHRVDAEEDWSSYRFSVDYPQDFEVIREVLTELYPRDPVFSLEALIAFMEARPRLAALQAGIGRYDGWKPALERDRIVGRNWTSVEGG